MTYHWKNLLLCGVVLGSSAAFAATDKDAKAPKIAPRVENVVVGEVGLGTETMLRKISSTIVAINAYDVMPRVSGDIVKQGFKDGTQVKKGQLLFQIDDTRYRAAVNAILAKIEKIKAQLEYAESNHKRNDELYSKKAVSKDSWESTKSTLASLKADLMAAQAELILAQDDLAHTRITALYDGTTGKSPYAPGNYITPASGKLNRIVDMRELRAKFSFGMRDYLANFGNEKNFRRNARIELILADGSVYKHPGTIEIVDTTSLVESADSLQVWVRFPNPEGILSPGGAVTVKLSKEDPEKYPAVPRQAIVYDRRGTKVYVVNDQNKVESRAVKTGTATDALQVIREGLKPGERVIVEGTHKVMPGTVVNPVPYRPEGSK